MRPRWGGVAACFLVAACGSGSPPSQGVGHRGGSQPPGLTQPIRVPHASTVCGAFKIFYGKLSSTPPQGHQIVLARYAQQVLRLAISHSSKIPRREFNDANSLVAYIGAPSFPYSGNILGRPIQRMETDCGF